MEERLQSERDQEQGVSRGGLGAGLLRGALCHQRWRDAKLSLVTRMSLSSPLEDESQIAGGQGEGDSCWCQMVGQFLQTCGHGRGEGRSGAVVSQEGNTAPRVLVLTSFARSSLT